MANKIREKVESEVTSNQSETTEAQNEPEVFDERVPEPETIVSEIADQSPKQDNNDEPAELPNFSNTPLQR